LEGFAFYLLFQNNNFHRASFLNSTNKISGGVYAQYSDFTDYLNLKEVNLQLAVENERLRGLQINAYEKLFGPNIIIDDTLYQRQYLFTKAKIINNSINKQNNYLTLNIGSNNGIENGMGVLAPNGVVGIVQNVSQNYSTVLSLLHGSAKISVKLKGSNYFGSMQWDGENYRQGILTDIPNHVNIQIGDTIVTSGFSATFPANIHVATIADFNKPKGENFYDIKLNFNTDFKNLSYVYVVKNSRSTEQLELEEETEESNG
jgi:rod shape-determining protein MreC